MCLILNIETATKNCSVSLAKNGKTIAFRNHQEENYSHAEKLHILIADVLDEVNHTLKDLDAIAVSAGPGSYTGLRIGVSSAKGLAYSLDKPLIAVDTLEILARQMTINDGIIIPMIDARRMEVFTAQFNAHFEKVSPTEAIILTEHSFDDIKSEVYLIGDCLEKAKTVLNQDKFHFAVKDSYPTAETMTEISFQHFNNQHWVDVAYFEPFYLKEFFLNKKA
jgi:tRNA threonylcarbamoyladenosine biosynthesis protein TsaB